MRRALTSLTLTLLAALYACGGRVVVDGDGSGVSSGSSAGGGGLGGIEAGGAMGSGGFAPHPPCAAADGTRVCGGDCPDLGPPDCPGYGCTDAFDVASLAVSSAGVCWDDLPGAASEQCFGCADGQACVQRTPDQLVCVPAAVCEALWDLSATGVCRYADKTRYDHQPLPAPTGACPGGGTTGICGGSCPACPNGGRCTGRSPSHPYGLCVYPTSPTSVPHCSIDPKGKVVGWDCAVTAPELACGVFAVPQADAATARRYPLCMGIEQCLTAAKYLPGGLLCYDANGKQIAP